jgi:uncharacterized GH25 family protein
MGFRVMRHAKLFATVVILGGALFSQEQQPGSSDLASVSGQVVRADSGNPLKSARVVLIENEGGERAHSYSTFSDENGLFSFTGVSAGRYRFAAGHAGFITQQYQPESTSAAGTLLDLSAAQKLDKVLFRLRAAGVITGTVNDEAGEPLAGIEVTALKGASRDTADGEMANNNVVPAGTATTNDLGEYRIYALPPGDYYVAAIDRGTSVLMESAFDGFFKAANEQVTDHPPMYYPGVFTRNEAQKLRVTGGDAERVDLTLRSMKAVKIFGRVVSENGQPAAGVYVLLTSRAMDATLSLKDNDATTDAQGTFAIQGILPGSYVLRAAAQQGPTSLSAEMEMEIAGDPPSGVLLRLERGVSLSGRVTVADGASAPALDLSSLRLWLACPQDSSLDSGVAEIKKNGGFTLNDLRRSTYSLHVDGLPRGWYLKSAYLGMGDVLASGVAPGGGTSSLLELTLSPKAAQLSGTVKDDNKPVPGAVVRIIPEHPSAFHRDLFKQTVTDQHGRFILDNLSPGTYLLQAKIVPAADAGEEGGATPTAMAAEKVNLADGSKQTVSLELSQQ